MAGLFERLQEEIDSQDQQKGLAPTDLLDLSPALSNIIKQIVRQNGMPLVDLAAELDQPADEVKVLLAELVKKGFVRQVQVKNEVWYKAYFKRRPGKAGTTIVWSMLDKLVE